MKAAEEALEEAKKAMSDGGEGNPAGCVRQRRNVERTLHKMAETLYKARRRVHSKREAASAGAGAGRLAHPAQARRAGLASPATSSTPNTWTWTTRSSPN